MRSEHYVHPEFGCFAPAPRLRRELRVGLLSMLFGMGLGVAAVTALSSGSRDHDGVSAPSIRSAGAVPASSNAAGWRQRQGR